MVDFLEEKKKGRNTPPSTLDADLIAAPHKRNPKSSFPLE
jgi:hypothetical protein